ncbi:MAG TPA: CCA tRNA nucleotidyltransferase [Rhizobiaceae bacterium]|nr:CCA tRNA nucleotidyltransferase [Rhizobiaceae bacterium]
MTSIAGRAPWLDEPDLQAVLAVLGADGEEARIAGGAVRNALLGAPGSDVDIATTNLPAETVARVQRAGFRAVPTGIDHGTVTVIAGGRPYEVTTLRDDVETDGRHARVVFGRDWKRDAERRDFTINALYADADGTVFDPIGGLADVESRTLRFIGKAEDRIREDYLRILRFFRFFAWYGAGRPDAEGLKACARLKDGLARLSAERVWSELRKLFSAPDPSRAILWMRQTGVLTAILPETEKWGIDALAPLIETEVALGWTPDALLRLMAVLPPDPARMEALSKRLRLSRAENDRLVAWAMAEPARADMGDLALSKMLYRGDVQGVRDRLALALAAARGSGKLAEAGAYLRQHKLAAVWERPTFPARGDDLAALGVTPGRRMGDLLRELESEWIDSGFQTGRDALLARAADLIADRPD